MSMTIKQALSMAADRLTAAGIDEAVMESRILLCHLLHREPAWLIAHNDERLSAQQRHGLDNLIQQRTDGIPIAHITGVRDFWKQTLSITPDTLIPRPETEHLVEWGLTLDSLAKDARILDIGTGSGAIAIALACEQPDWRITATDISQAALEIARLNAEQHQVTNIRFMHSDGFSALQGERFELIISNPPYVAEQDPHLQQGDVRFEPSSALVSGIDGLDMIRQLISQAPSHLLPGGWLAMEHGWDQGEAIRGLLQQQGYNHIQTLSDYSGHERISVAQYPA